MRIEQAKDELTVYLPDTRGVVISPYGKGNMKIGPDIYTYSKLPGRVGGTCPGATPLCQDVCYAMRVVREREVWRIWRKNTARKSVPPLPPDAKIVRWHVGGDFDTPYYIQQWWNIANEHPDVLFFGYTRSWRVPELLNPLTRLQRLPNVQLFASMDADVAEPPPDGWRRAWLQGDARAEVEMISVGGSRYPLISKAYDGASIYACPEELGRKASCQECGYCYRGRHGDVIFLLH